uniref:Uncharacterized protein n=3 Tax=Oryza TaxID=4527 RepID=A0A0D3FZT0_9ORYZ
MVTGKNLFDIGIIEVKHSGRQPIVVVKLEPPSLLLAESGMCSYRNYQVASLCIWQRRNALLTGGKWMDGYEIGPGPIQLKAHEY